MVLQRYFYLFCIVSRCDNEDDWEKGYKYAQMAELTPLQVMDRLKKLEADAKEVFSWFYEIYLH